MNDMIMNSKSALTMSSLEMSRLVEARHDSVKRTIDTLAEKGVIEFPQIEGIKTATKPVTCYLVNKRDSYVVVAQLSPEFTARLVDRWQELEASISVQVPQTLSQALRLAADQADQIDEQQKLLEHQKPAVEFVEKFVETKSNRSLREVAKVLGVKEGEFIARLIEERILFRQSGNILPIATHQHAGRFTVKTGSSNGHAFQQTRFTPLGITWITKRFGLISGECAA